MYIYSVRRIQHLHCIRIRVIYACKSRIRTIRKQNTDQFSLDHASERFAFIYPWCEECMFFDSISETLEVHYFTTIKKIHKKNEVLKHAIFLVLRHIVTACVAIK